MQSLWKNFLQSTQIIVSDSTSSEQHEYGTETTSEPGGLSSACCSLAELLDPKVVAAVLQPVVRPALVVRFDRTGAASVLHA